MKRLVILFAAASLLSTPSWAQNQPAKEGPNNSAVNTSNQNNSNAPVAGANSFTEGQARSRIEDAGFTAVSDLKKDDNGVWRGKGTKNGKQMEVSLDFQGNVNPTN